MKYKFIDKEDAIFSQCGKYRYALWRIWDDTKPLIAFIGLNPSTATQKMDDPTIRRVIRFAKDWGYGGVCMLNLFAYVTAYPEELAKCDDPIADNDQWLSRVGDKCTDILFAWGSFAQAKARALDVIKLFPKATCLGFNKDGSPKHPLYVAAKTKQMKFA